ncbi:MAG TPA: phytanoyl-CoA dioxygenase family protein [Acidimicrobiales bacterium]|nr:phytanoyl-CoA dioxygenase family protein [Acidimicrobiales bacterium]
MRELDAKEVQAHVARVAADGYTIIEDAFPASFADEVRADLERLESELGIQPAGNRFEGAQTVRIYNLLAHGVIYQRIAEAPSVLPVVDGVLDPGCLVSSLSSIAICPGERAQPIHADDQLIPIPKPHPPTVCNTMWAITDFTEDNGATRLMPGTHRSDSNPDFTASYEDRTIGASMEKGSVLVWHGSLWHGGGANRTDERRYGIAMNYCAGYIRQQENQQLGLAADLVRTFSPRLQTLVGYGIYNGLMGHIDKASPASLLGTTPPGGMIWDAVPASGG